MVARKVAPVPVPVVVTTVCSMCGLAWERHGENPTTEDCIRLLKAELAAQPAPITVVRPYVSPSWPIGIWCGGVQAIRNTVAVQGYNTNDLTPTEVSCTYNTPALSNRSPAAA